MTKDITSFISSITWSGSVSEACRSLSIEVLFSPLDNNIKDPDIKLGDRLKLLTDEQILLINAMVYSRERKSEQGTIAYDAYDDLRHLVKSKITRNFKNTTAEAITKSICSELKVSTGTIAKTGINIKKLVAESETGYAIMIKAYRKASKSTKEKYMPYMVGQKLSVIKKGELVSGFTLGDDCNITDASYAENIEDIVNRVRIYNDKGKRIGEVENKASVEKYGIFQEVYTKEEDVQATAAAKAMLQGKTKEASIEALGNVKCISGYAVKIKDKATGLSGKFWIESDTHTWQDNTYTMQLDLAFKNLMDS